MSEGNTPLIAAAAEGDILKVQELIDTYTAQGNLNVRLEETSRDDGFTPLLWACMNSDTDTVRLLLGAGADPTNPGMTKRLYEHKITPLGVANERVLADGSVNQDIIYMLLEARIKREEPRSHKLFIKAAKPPYGKNFLKVAEKYSTRRIKYRRASLQQIRKKKNSTGTNFTRLRRVSLSGGSRKTRRAQGLSLL